MPNARSIDAAISLHTGEFTGDERPLAIPLKAADLEDLRPHHALMRGQSAKNGYLVAAAIAAKGTHRTIWQQALVKHWVSLRTCSLSLMEHHPNEGNRFSVEKDPINVAIISQAIVAAFSCIEELKLQVRASSQQPAKIEGKWNPIVFENLNRRLTRAKIKTEEPFMWMLRSSATRIERKHKPPAGSRTRWASRYVRDRNISIFDAIHYAGLLRNKVSAHASNPLTKSLTLIDMCNVQCLARRLILETLGFWRS